MNSYLYKLRNKTEDILSMYTNKYTFQHMFVKSAYDLRSAKVLNLELHMYLRVLTSLIGSGTDILFLK